MTTLNYQVGASGDDGWQNAGGTVDITGAVLGNLTTGSMWAGARFAGIAVAQGADSDVISATFQLYVVNATNDDLNADIYGEAADDAASYVASSNNISGRSLTTSKTTVTQTGIASGGGTWFSIDVTAQVREIVNRAGWASGNALAIIIDCLGSGNQFSARTWDHAGGLGPKLDIEYVASGTGQPMVARARLVPGMRRPHGHQGW